MAIFSFKKKRKIKINKQYVAGLEASHFNLQDKLNKVVAQYRELDETFFEKLEEILILCDVGPQMTLKIVDEVQKEVKLNNIDDPELVQQILVDKMFVIYTNKLHLQTQLNIQPDRLNCILISGVNGSGKTTTLAKLANLYKNLNYKILVVAGDTFRAGAIEQLSVWCKSIGVDFFRPEYDKQDCASVCYAALKYAKEADYNLVLCDTSGRLQNKVNLMNELSKVVKVVQKFIPDAPHDHILVLDAMIGQNSLMQARVFKEATQISGIVLTKIDGTSKGGIVLTIQDELKTPVKFICFGEKIDDIAEFDLDVFLTALVSKLKEN